MRASNSCSRPHDRVMEKLKKDPQTLRVAFLDGDSDLHGDIAEATREIAKSLQCSLGRGVGKDYHLSTIN